MRDRRASPPSDVTLSEPALAASATCLRLAGCRAHVATNRSRSLPMQLARPRPASDKEKFAIMAACRRVAWRVAATKSR
jgi:hypothetical protein